MDWFKQHVDTVVILTAFGSALLWMNGRFNELDKDLTIVKTVLILKEAREFVGLSNASIWKAIKYERKSGGYHWAYWDGKMPQVTSGATPFIQVK